MTAAAPWIRRSGAKARLMPLLGLAMLCWSVAPAAAQLGWFDQPETSVQDVYDTISSHGFRLAGPLMRTRDVYIADVYDRRQRRERLIISRDSGQIVQRFMVDVGRAAPYADAGTASAAPRGRRTDDDFFSRMIHGFGEDNPPRPPADVGTAEQEAVEPPVMPRAPQKLARPRPSDIEPRVLTKREDAPITSRPLTPAPAAPPAASAPATTAPSPAAPAAATPPPAAPAPEKAQSSPPAASPAPPRATVVITDPLRIPGTRETAPKPAAPATAVAKSTPPAPAPAPVPPPVPAKAPAPKPAPSNTVPVAPLD